MTARIILVTALVAAVTAVVATTAMSAPAVFKNCGGLAAGGHQWTVTSVAVTCPRAKGLVRKLATKSHPAAIEYKFPGSYLGMGCTEIQGNGQREINCSNRTSTKVVLAVSRH